MKLVTRKACLTVTVLLFSVFTFCATGFAQKGVEVGEAITLDAEVVAIDKADRLLTLRGPEGNVVQLEVGEEARNFDQIRVGDQIKVTYYESIAVYLGAPGSQPEEEAGLVMARTEKGDMPGGVAIGAVDISAKVIEIDKPTRTLILELADGKKVTREVDPAVAAFDTIKVGDMVHARLTKALAISVERP